MLKWMGMKNIIFFFFSEIFIRWLGAEELFFEKSISAVNYFENQNWRKTIRRYWAWGADLSPHKQTNLSQDL